MQRGRSTHLLTHSLTRSDKGACAIVTGCARTLQYLSCGCNGVSDETLLTCAEIGRLKEFYSYKCPGITDRGVEQLLATPSIISVTASSCSLTPPMENRLRVWKEKQKREEQEKQKHLDSDDDDDDDDDS